MRFKIIISLLLLPILTYSQEKKRFQLAINYSPNYDNFKFIGKNKEYFNDMGKYKKTFVGYTYGVTLKTLINNKFGFETGVFLTKKGVNLEDGDNFSYTENYISTEIPLIFSYQIIDTKIQCSVNFGANLNFTNRFKGKLYHFDNRFNLEPVYLNYSGQRFIDLFSKPVLTQTLLSFRFNEDKDFRVFNIIPNISVSLSKRITERFYLGIEPIFRTSLLNQSLNKFESVTGSNSKFEREFKTSQVFWSVGMNTFICFTL